MSTYPINPFSSSHRCFSALVSKLSGDGTAHLDHGDIERLIETEGREVMRQLMQDHIDLRSHREAAEVAPAWGYPDLVDTSLCSSSRGQQDLSGNTSI